MIPMNLYRYNVDPSGRINLNPYQSSVPGIQTQRVATGSDAYAFQQVQQQQVAPPQQGEPGSGGGTGGGDGTGDGIGTGPGTQPGDTGNDVGILPGEGFDPGAVWTPDGATGTGSVATTGDPSFNQGGQGGGIDWGFIFGQFPDWNQGGDNAPVVNDEIRRQMEEAIAAETDPGIRGGLEEELRKMGGATGDVEDIRAGPGRSAGDAIKQAEQWAKDHPDSPYSSPDSGGGGFTDPEIPRIGDIVDNPDGTTTPIGDITVDEEGEIDFGSPSPPPPEVIDDNGSVLSDIIDFSFGSIFGGSNIEFGDDAPSSSLVAGEGDFSFGDSGGGGFGFAQFSPQSAFINVFADVFGSILSGGSPGDNNIYKTPEYQSYLETKDRYRDTYWDSLFADPGFISATEEWDAANPFGTGAGWGNIPDFSTAPISSDQYEIDEFPLFQDWISGALPSPIDFS